MSTTTRPSPGGRRALLPAQLTDLVAAHRQAQAAHHAALAAEADKAIATATHRVHALADAARRIAGPALADALTREVGAGSALVVALTSDDATSREVDEALLAYQARRTDSDALVVAVSRS